MLMLHAITVHISGVVLLGSAVSNEAPFLAPPESVNQCRSSGCKIEHESPLLHHLPYLSDERRPDPDSLIIGKNHEPVNSLPALPHGKLDDASTARKLAIDQTDVIFTASMKLRIQIVMLPENFPKPCFMLAVNPVYLKFEWGTIELFPCAKKRFSSVL